MDPNPAPQTTTPNRFFDRKILVIVVIIIAVIIGVVFYIYLNRYRNINPTNPIVNNNKIGAPAAKNDLGTTLYEKSQNPISNTLPKTVAPVANPLQNVYKNPFQ